MGFLLREKHKNSIEYPISHRKGYIHFCRPMPLSLKKGKIIFRTVILKNIVFSKKLSNKKYSKPHFSQKKGCIDFCRQMPPFPSKRPRPSTNGYGSFFRKYCFF